MPDVKKQERLSALKVINKNALHPDEVMVIRGEAKILEMLVNERNIVQIKDVSKWTSNKLSLLVLRDQAAHLYRDGVLRGNST